MKDQISKYKDYQDYIDNQNRGYSNKVLTHSGVGVETVQQIQERIPTAERVMCHGTRAGAEQKFFMKVYDAEAIGTEIGEGCEQYDHTIQWDFHEQKDEWIQAFDIVYTNCFDHAVLPEKALTTWFEQVKPGGSLVIEFHGGAYKGKPIRGNWTKVDPNNNYYYEDVDAFLESIGAIYDCQWQSPQMTFDKDIHLDSTIKRNQKKYNVTSVNPYTFGRRTARYRRPE